MNSMKVYLCGIIYIFDGNVAINPSFSKIAIITAIYLLHLQDYAPKLRIIIAIYLLQCAPDHESQLHWTS